MNWFKSVFRWFLVIFVVAWIASFLITVFIAPAVACAFGFIYAACQSGSTLYLFISMWILPAIMALVISPYAVKYNRMKKELEDMIDAQEDEADADR